MRSSVPSAVIPVETTEPYFLSDAHQIGKKLASLKEAGNADLSVIQQATQVIQDHIDSGEFIAEQ